LPGVPGRRRVDRLRRGDLRRPDRHHCAVLDLHGDHRFVDVEPRGVELDPSVKRDDVERRQRVTDLLRIEAARLLDRQLQRERAGAALGVVVIGNRPVPDPIKTSGWRDLMLVRAALRSGVLTGYFWKYRTFKLLCSAQSFAAFATSSENRSSADKIATVSGLGLSETAAFSMALAYSSAGLRTPKMYLYPCRKILRAAPFDSTSGILYFSAIAASAKVAGLPYGPNRKLTWSWLMSLSVSSAEIWGLLWSS